MRFNLFLFFIFLALSVHAQTAKVEGKCFSKNKKALEGVIIRSSHDSTAVHYTERDGYFSFTVQENVLLTISFTFEGEKLYRNLTVSPKEVKKMGDIVFNVILEDQVIVAGKERSPITLENIPLNTLVTQDIGRALVYTTAATSQNELTSNYSVRGGNYDENLVYVNDFLINRPFLTRAGQQEGLNFVYTALVDDISFSAGGFDSKYGDKLSSVLDIKYKVPDSLNASLMASLLGVEAHVAHKTSNRFNYLIGARYRANGYLLNSLPTKGNYNPVFWDAQSLINYNINEKLVWSTLVHFSSNNYRFAPETSQTEFGTLNESYKLNIYYDGQENSTFQTMTAGTALKWAVTPRTQLDFYAQAFTTDEREFFDIEGQYFINLLEKDASKATYGDSIATVGIGSFLNHARNNLKAKVFNFYHNGSHQLNEKTGATSDKESYSTKQRILWGVNFQQDYFTDQLSEWNLIDSAGYNLPQQPVISPVPVIELSDVIKGNLKLNTSRISGYAQYTFDKNRYKKEYPVTVKYNFKDAEGNKQRYEYTDTLPSSFRKFVANVGLRSGYTEINNEFYVTPRASVYFYPRSFFYRNGRIARRNTLFRVSTGMYYQPPFYREFRTFDGDLNTHVKSQKSWHFVVGSEFNFSMWNRSTPFKFTAEAYYKYLWDVNPYKIDNVRTRYYAENNAIAYAYGVDMNVHGEFVEGVHSFFKVGFLSTKENLNNDSYKEYYNAAGEKIVFGYSEDQVVVDSMTFYPGYIPRPTDQMMNFAILFQDNMPNLEQLTAQLGLIYGTRLPYGPPGKDRYPDTLRQKSYFRVDLGISYDFLYQKKKAGKLKTKYLSDAILSFEVFNLLGVNNVLSHQWLQDVTGNYFAVSNYLTQRRYNLKLILRM